MFESSKISFYGKEMEKVFHDLIKEHVEPLGYTISKVTGTKHWNVLRIYDPSDKKYYIAKGILHIEGDNELGPTQMDKAFQNETTILSKLPDWWGLSLKDSFKKDSFRVVITPEIPNCKWTQYKGNDKGIAKIIVKQIEWLHSHKIAHNDLELKNILLSCDNKNATIIDFEKATLNSSSTSMRNDYKQIIQSLNEREETKGIAKKIESLAFSKLPLRRRFSFGGKTRRKRSKTYKKK
jgi:serine/threonine protein kinase